MAATAFILMALALVGSSSSSPQLVQEVPSGNDLVHLGHLRIPSQDGKSFDRKDYYMGLQASTWDVGKADCAKIVSGQQEGGLVSIETPEELTFLEDELLSQGSGQVYWTGGQYKAGKWIWSATKERIPFFARPATTTKVPGPKDRLILNEFDSTFDFQQDSIPQRYICEKRTIRCPKC